MKPSRSGMAAGEQELPTRARTGRAWKVGVGVLVVGGLVLAGRRGAEALPGVLESVRDLGAVAALAFIGA